MVSFLRSRHPQKTAVNVAAETGCSVDQVEKWLERSSLPNGHGCLALVAAYGPEFLCAVIPSPPEWLNAAHREARRQRLEAEISARQAELDALRSAT